MKPLASSPCRAHHSRASASSSGALAHVSLAVLPDQLPRLNGRRHSSFNRNHRRDFLRRQFFRAAFLSARAVPPIAEVA